VKLHQLSVQIDNGPTFNGWHTDSNHESVIFFTHGNGFSSRVYEPLLQILAERYDLILLDLPGHGSSPDHEFVGWTRTSEYLRLAVEQCNDLVSSRSTYAVAHSLGGLLFLMIAGSNKNPFRSMVLLDPVMYRKPLLYFLRTMYRLRLTKSFHPFVKPTLNRRNGWKNRHEAFNYFHGRKIFRNWTDPALQSYIDFALIDVSDDNQNSGVMLRCDPALEARWFATPPDNFWPVLSNVQIPVSVFMGQDSYPFSNRAAHRAARVSPQLDLTIVPGDHSFMQQYPEQAAQYVFASVD